MNKDWIKFLAANSDTRPTHNHTSDSPESSESITAISNLTILKVSGKDSSHFLQGQLTCNMKELTDNNSFFSAFCNVKGRAISTLIVLKNNDDFLLVLPTQLADKVSKKLQMYILRSDVKLTNMTEELCLMGLNTSSTTIFNVLPDADFSVSNTDILVVKVPASPSRYLIIAEPSQAMQHWSRITNDCNINPSSSDNWDYQDISASIPWLTQQSSEEFIPQMLNIDKLGGISFNKGCYTGQEIIARTHYLGKAKRALYIAECSIDAKLDINTRILIDDKTQSNSQILSFQPDHQRQKILLVMPTSDAELKNLTLNNSNQDKISLINFQ